MTSRPTPHPGLRPPPPPAFRGIFPGIFHDIGSQDRLGLLLVLASLCACTPSAPEISSLPAIPAVPYEAIEPSVEEQFRDAEAALRSAPLDGAQNGRLGMLFHAYEWAEEADACYHRAEILDAKTPRWSYYRALLALDAGRAEDALGALERTLARGGKTLAAVLRRGELALEREDLNDAERWFQQALEQTPGSPHALLGRGRLQARRGAAEAAIRTFEQILRERPDFRPAHYRLALAYRQQNKTEEARRHLEAYERLGGNFEVPDALLAEVRALRLDSDRLARRASRLLKAGNPTEALRLYEEIVARDAGSNMARYNLALCLQRLDRHEEALAHYDTFLAARPSSADGHNNRGLALEALGKLDDAREAFREAVSVEPRYFPGFLNLARLSELAGDRETAFEHYEKASEIRPRRHEPRLARSRLLALRGDPRAAVAELSNALEHAPAELELHDELLRHFGPSPASGTTRRRAASFLKREGRFSAAVISLRRSYREHRDWRDGVALAWLLSTCSSEAHRRPGEALSILEPLCREQAAGDPVALDTLAAAYAGVGRYDDAQRTAEEALRLAQAADSESSARRAERIASRLTLYRDKKPFVEP